MNLVSKVRHIVLEHSGTNILVPGKTMYKMYKNLALVIHFSNIFYALA